MARKVRKILRIGCNTFYVAFFGCKLSTGLIQLGCPEFSSTSLIQGASFKISSCTKSDKLDAISDTLDGRYFVLQDEVGPPPRSLKNEAYVVW